MVYPRVCGGTRKSDIDAKLAEGLSPRVRGNHAFVQVDIPQQGSIPACAGEPYQTDRQKCYAGVYPRVCGGTAQVRPTPADADGLSPRVRGNR